MRPYLYSISILALAACIALGLKMIRYPHASGYAAYGFLSLFLVFLVSALILALNVIIFRRRGIRTVSDKGDGSKWNNRRRSYRINYPPHQRPRLIVESTDDTPRRGLEYAVMDLSQDGVRILDDGSLGSVEGVSGVIHMDHQSNLRFMGTIIQLHGNYIGIRFHHSLPWAMLLEEQRRLLTHTSQ